MRTIRTNETDFQRLESRRRFFPNDWKIAVATAFMVVVASHVAHANLASNPGFETQGGGGATDAADWTQFGALTREGWAPESGSWGMAHHGWSNSDGGFYQDISTDTNAHHYFRVRLWFGAQYAGRTLEQKVEYFNSSDTLLVAYTNFIGTPSDETWRSYDIDGPAVGAADYVRVVLYYPGASEVGFGEQSARADNVMVYNRTKTYRPGEILEEFSYDDHSSVNTLNGKSRGGGWTNDWIESNAGAFTANDGSFGAVTGYPPMRGNKVLVTPPNDTSRSARRHFAGMNTGRVYAAYHMNYAFDGADKFAGMSFMQGSTELAFFGEVFTADETLGLSVTNHTETSSFTLNAGVGEDYVIIGMYDFATRELKTIAYYKTATIPTAEPSTWDAELTLGSGTITHVDGIRIASGAGSGAGTPGATYFDEIRVARSWHELLNQDAEPVWDGDGADANWDTVLNWKGNALPAAGDIVTFYDSINSGTNINLNGDRTVEGLRFNENADSNLRIYNNTLTINEAGIAIDSGAGGAHIIASAVAMGEGQSWTNASSANFTVSGIMSGAANNLTKAGSGRVILSGNNTFTGTLTVAAGTLEIRHANGLGATSGGTTVDSGAAVALNAEANYAAEPLTLNGTGESNGGALRKIDTGTRQYPGDITLASDARINTDGGSLDLRGDIDLDGNTLYIGGNFSSLMGSGATLSGATKTTGDGALVKDGSSFFRLRPDSGLTGSILISEGELRIDVGTGGIPAGGTLTMEDGTGLSTATATDRSSSKNMLISGDVSLAVVSSGNLTIGGAVDLDAAIREITVGNTATMNGILSNGGLTKAGAGTMTLAAANTYAGDTRVAAGTLSLTHASALQNSILDMNGGDSGSVSFGSPSLFTLGGLSGSRNLDMGTKALSVGNNGSNTTYSGVLSNGSLNKIGAGTLTLSGANTHAGATIVSNGVLVMTGSATNSTFTVRAGATLAGNGPIGPTFVFGTVSPGQSITNLAVEELTLEEDGEYVWEIANVAGTPGDEWDVITVSNGIGGVTVDATAGNPFTIVIDSMGGTPTGWSSASDYDWIIIDAGSVTAFDETKFVLDTTDFDPDLNGGTFSIAEDSGNIVLSFTAAAASDIDVYGNGQIITNNSANPSLANHTDFGDVYTSGGTLTRTYTITNTATEAVGLGTVTTSGTHAADFVVIAQPAVSINAGATTTFQVQFDPSADGTRTATVSFTNTTSVKNPYTFDIQGTGVTPSIVRAPTSLSPSTTLGSDPAAGGFGVTNAGTGVLNYNITTNQSWLSVNPVDGSLAAAAGQQHTVTYNGTAALGVGVHNATITITSAEADNSPQTVSVELTINAIPAPTSQDATTDGPEMVRLIWTKDASYDVLIVFNSTNAPSAPTQGVAYDPGDAVGGDGSRVIYKGSGAALEHIVPELTTAHYAFYSVNNDYYSDGVSAAATTPPFQDFLVIDPFAYTNQFSLSGADGGVGWTNAWLVDDGTFTVVRNTDAQPHFQQFVNYAEMSGNRVRLDNPGDGEGGRVIRNFEPITDGRIYAGYIFSYEFAGNNKYAGMAFLSNSVERAFYGMPGASTNRLGLDSFGGSMTLSSYQLESFQANTGNVYLVIGRYDFDTREFSTIAYYRTDSIDVFEPETWAATATVPAGWIESINGIMIVGGAIEDSGVNIGDVYYDEIRVARTWNELLDLIEPLSVEFEINAGDTVTDADILSGNFPVVYTWQHQQGFNTTNTNAPFFIPNFDIFNTVGTQILTDQVFDVFTHLNQGTLLFASNTSHAGAAPAEITLGVYTSRWSVITSNQIASINSYELKNPYLANFDGAGETKGSYASNNVTLSGVQWSLDGVLIGTTGSDKFNGVRAARLRRDLSQSPEEPGNLMMIEDKANGIGTISLLYARFGSDAVRTNIVEYSLNSGATWTEAGRFHTDGVDTLTPFIARVDRAGDNARVRVRADPAGPSVTSGRRVNIDDIRITDFPVTNQTTFVVIDDDTEPPIPSTEIDEWDNYSMIASNTTTRFEAVGDGQAAIHRISDGQLAEDPNLSLLFNVWDRYSGLQRGTSTTVEVEGRVLTNTRIHVSGWITNNTAQYYADWSDADTTHDQSYSTWRFQELTFDDVGDLWGPVPTAIEGYTNAVFVHMFDLDNDRVGDQASQQATLGFLQLYDDDIDPPLLGGPDVDGLLLNPGFDVGTGTDATNWVQWDGLERQGGAARNGDAGMALLGWTTGGGFYQDFASTHADVAYTFTIWGGRSWDWASPDPDHSISMFIQFLDSGFTIIDSATTTSFPGNNDEWNQYSVSGTSPPGTAFVRVGVEFNGPAGGSGWFRWDDADLTYAGIEAPMAVRIGDRTVIGSEDATNAVFTITDGELASIDSTGNLIEDAGFESGAFDPWHFFGPSTNVYDGHWYISSAGPDVLSGTYSVGHRVSDGDRTVDATNHWRGVYQRFEAEEGEVYHASTFIRTVNLWSSVVFLEIQFMDNSLNILQTYTSEIVDGIQEFRLTEVTEAVAPAGTEYVGVQGVVLTQFDTGVDEFILFDEFSLRRGTALNISLMAYDVDSGLSHGTDPDNDDLSHMTVGTWIENDVEYYLRAISSPDSSSSSSFSTWEITGPLGYEEVGELYDGEYHTIYGTFSDADFDRPNDNLWLSNQQFGILRVIDDDEDPPVLGPNPLVVSTNGAVLPQHALTNYLIAGWNFNNDGDRTGASHGAGVFSSALTGTLTFISGAGVDNNAVAGDPAEQGMSVFGTANNGGHFTFQLDMSAYEDLVMTFAARRQNDGYNTNTVSYSLNGTDFTAFSTFAPGTLAVYTNNFSSVEALNGHPTVYIRITLNGATGNTSTHNNHYDNFRFNAARRPANLLAGWNFNATNTVVAHGAGTFINNLPGTVNFFGGTTLNAVDSDPAGVAFSPSTTGNNGHNFQYRLDMRGRKDLSVSFASWRSGTGYDSVQLAWSTNGADFTDLGAPINPPTSGTPWSNGEIFTRDFSSVAALNNVPEVYIRFTVSGATGTGNTRFDNVQFNTHAFAVYRITDAELTNVSDSNPLRFSFNVYDEISGIARGVTEDGTNMVVNVEGLWSDNASGYAAGLSMANTRVPGSTSVWEFAESLTPQEITAMYGDGSTPIPVRATVADADNDRPNDSSWISNAFFGAWQVIDDDEHAPELRNIGYRDLSTRDRPLLVAVSNSVVPRTGTGPESVLTVTDADLRNSGSRGMEFAFGVIDRASGVARPGEWIGGDDTNSVINVSIGEHVIGNYANYTAGMSSPNYVGSATTNVWTFADDFFGYEMVGEMFDEGVVPVYITLVDNDNDRSADQSIDRSVLAGSLNVIDDDTEPPQMTALTLNSESDPHNLFVMNFSTFHGWTNTASATSYTSRTNDIGEDVWVGNHFAVPSNPLPHGRRMSGSNVGAYQNTTSWLEMPAREGLGTLFVWGILSSGTGPRTLQLEGTTNGTDWIDFGSRDITSAVEYQLLTWNVDHAGPMVLRLSRTGSADQTIYIDDIALTAQALWTNLEEISVTFDDAIDQNGISQYRALTNSIPDFARGTNIAQGVLLATNSATFAVPEGIVTGFVFAVDADDDRPNDRLRNAGLPYVARIDRTPPDLVVDVTAIEGPDETSEVELTWTPVEDGGGTEIDGYGYHELSPWRSYVLFYTHEDRAPHTNDQFISVNNGPSTLGTNTTSSAIFSNFSFGTEYRFSIAGQDEAGNLGPLSAPVTNFFQAFSITQGMARTSSESEIYWTAATNTQGEIIREYDLIRTDANNYWGGLSNASMWELVDTEMTNMMSDFVSIGAGQMRFYRASPAGRWMPQNSVPVASEEVYLAKPVALHPGQNWVAFPGIPDSSTVVRVFGTALPMGASPATATKISWFDRIEEEVVTQQVYFAFGEDWQYSVGGSGSAADVIVPLDQGVVVEIPSAESPTSFLFIGRVPTNELSQILVGGGAANLISARLPRHMHPNQMNLLESGFTGSPFPFESDLIWKYDRSAQSVPQIIYYNTGAMVPSHVGWRVFGQAYPGPLVTGTPFGPDDAVVIWTMGSTTNWNWTLNPATFYGAPSRYLAP